MEEKKEVVESKQDYYFVKTDNTPKNAFDSLEGKINING